MPKDDARLPNVLERLGVAAWELPRGAIRQTSAHSHPEAQLCGLDAGLAILETEVGAWTCPPGRCVWIPPGLVHSLRSCGKISGWMVRLDTRKKAMPREPCILALSPLLKEVVMRMMTWAEHPEANAAKRRLVDVLHDEICSASQVHLHLPVPRDPALKRLAMRMAEDSLGGTKDLAVLAREVGVSERSLFRNFQKETGLSPGQWRRQMQVLRSLELLAKGRSVTETALEVGYESVGAFTRAFRESVGLTPMEYADQRRSS